MTGQTEQTTVPERKLIMVPMDQAQLAMVIYSMQFASAALIGDLETQLLTVPFLRHLLLHHNEQLSTVVSAIEKLCLATGWHRGCGDHEHA